MKRSMTLCAQATTLSTMALLTMSGAAVAADAPMRPMFTYLKPALPKLGAAAAATSLPTWTDKWTYKGTSYSALFVGKSPATGISSTVPVYIIPIKLTYKTKVTDPQAKNGSGKSTVDYTTASPIFNAGIDYVQKGTDIGNTQYEDAFERAALWGQVKKHASYHVLLGKPTVEPEQSLTVPNGQGTIATAFGQSVIIANINWFDPAVTPLLASLKIPADSLPIFMITQTYLSGNSGTSGCCIGGYHSVASSGLPYSVFTYISNSGSTLAFSQDVSALSHEVGEWMNDPLTNNSKIPSLCGANGNSIYENGDPIEVDANYGDYPYALNGFTYHLQDLVLPTYFGAPAGTVPTGLNQSFQGTKFSVCQNGG